LSRGCADVDAVRARPRRDRRARRGARAHAAVADERVAHGSRARRRGQRARRHELAPVDARQHEHGPPVARDELRRLGRGDGGDLVAGAAVVRAQVRA
jgi:hypothetical protein